MIQSTETKEKSDRPEFLRQEIRRLEALNKQLHDEIFELQCEMRELKSAGYSIEAEYSVLGNK